MWRLILVLLMLSGAVCATPECKPSESSQNDLLRATEIVQRLPELAGWTHSRNSIVFDTGSREKVGRWCYDTVYVYGVNPNHDLDLRYVFAVHTRTILVEDMPSAEFISLKRWRASNAHGNEP